MHINADFTARVVVHARQLPWVASPVAGVDRRMLDRVGGEVARATSIVRYAARSSFSPHVHSGGEEFLVLDGVFQDEHGDFPAGCYVRNPPMSRHTPRSEPGCIIFVKLWQFDPDDRKHVRIDTNTRSFADDPLRAGVQVMPLYQDAHETVTLEQWRSDTTLQFAAPDGMEILVLEGSFNEGGDRLVQHSWLRLPAGSDTIARVGDAGARVWIKRGHLRSPRMAPPSA